MSPRRGEVWWGEHEEFGRRPYLVMTRDVAIGVLDRVTVVPLTRTIRGIPTEVRIGHPRQLSGGLARLGVQRGSSASTRRRRGRGTRVLGLRARCCCRR